MPRRRNEAMAVAPAPAPAAGAGGGTDGGAGDLLPLISDDSPSGAASAATATTATSARSDSRESQSIVVLQTSPPPEAEARALATALASQYKGLVANFRTRLQIDAAEAEGEVQAQLLALVQRDGDIYGVRTMPPSEVQWPHLMALAEHNPDLMLGCWRAINQAALDALVSGQRAAAAVAVVGETPWEQAQFLALRASFIQEWQPRGGIELSLIDTMAQALTLQERWTKMLISATARQMEHGRSTYSDSLRPQPPRLSDAQAVEQAGGMIDRFNRLYLRTLRQLRDLRRYTPIVMIESADQVNVGGQQINVAAERDLGDTSP